MIISVSELNSYIKEYLDANPLFNNLYVKGEISNIKLHTSGHIYLSLKDEKSVIKAVMFRFSASKLNFRPENGMKVIVNARLSSFERDGIYQLYINEMQPDGIGALHLKFEQLKEKLSKEGLFDEQNKKKIPKIPDKIGIITSPTGAAIRDIINIIKRRFPSVNVYIYPALVQGAQASSSLINGLKFFNDCFKVDVIIMGRGGGSIEDLWCFNEENVARAIYESKIPIISAVGHETDYTISDFAADLRAPTPSAAAELCVPSVFEIKNYLNTAYHRLGSALLGSIERQKLRLKAVLNSRLFKNPYVLIENNIQLVTNMTDRLINCYINNISKKKENYIENISKLDSLSPLKVLKRGYTFVENNNGDIIDSVKKINLNEDLKLRYADGSALVKVLDKEEKI